MHARHGMCELAHWAPRAVAGGVAPRRAARRTRASRRSFRPQPPLLTDPDCHNTSTSRARTSYRSCNACSCRPYVSAFPQKPSCASRAAALNVESRLSKARGMSGFAEGDAAVGRDAVGARGAGALPGDAPHASCQVGKGRCHAPGPRSAAPDHAATPRCNVWGLSNTAKGPGAGSGANTAGFGGFRVARRAARTASVTWPVTPPAAPPRAGAWPFCGPAHARRPDPIV